MDFIIPLFYGVLLTWLVTQTPFFIHSGISKKFLVVLFLIKIFSALAYGFYFSQPAIISSSDSWKYFHLSQEETDWLLHDPIAFLKDLFTSGYKESSNIFLEGNSYWNDLKSNVIIKIMAVCNVLTFKNYYANALLLNYVFFFGPIAVYRVFVAKKKEHFIAALFIFCIPSFLFWCSGAHKDGLLFTCIGLVIYFFHQQIKPGKINYPYIIYILLLLAVIFALRNFLAFLLLPALLVWGLCHFYPRKKWLNVTLVYGLGILFFFASGSLKADLNFPGYIIKKQTEFKVLGGDSQIDLPNLEPDFISFVSFLPYAMDISFLRPHFSEWENTAAIFSTLELAALWLIVLFAIAARNKEISFNRPFIIFCLCYSLSILILSGYTVSLSGAIVRYRSIVLPLLITPFAVQLFRPKRK